MDYNNINVNKCYKRPYLDPVTRWYLFNYMPFVRKGISLPITDAIRMGRELKIETKDQELKDRIGKIYEELDNKIEQMLIEAGVFGSAVIVLGLLDATPDKPINYNRLNPQSILHMTVLNCTNFTVDIEQDWFSSNYNQPKRYICTLGDKQMEVHPSRILLGFGNRSQSNLKYSELDLGTSIIDGVYFILDDEFDTAIDMAHLVRKSNVDLISIPNLNMQLANIDRDGDSKIKKVLNLFKNLLSVHKVLIMDSDNKLARIPIPNLDSVKNINEFQLEKIAGAFDIPVERFLNKVKSTLNNGSGNNKDNYSHKTKDILHNKIKPIHLQFDLITEAMFDVKLTYTYADFKSTTDQEKIELFKSMTDVANINLLNQVWEQPEVIEFYKRYGLNIGKSLDLPKPSTPNEEQKTEQA